MRRIHAIALGVGIALAASEASAQSPGDLAVEREKIALIAKVTLSVEAPESPQILRGGLNDASPRVRAAARHR